jgi:hypothetical protein
MTNISAILRAICVNAILVLPSASPNERVLNQLHTIHEFYGLCGTV